LSTFVECDENLETFYGFHIQSGRWRSSFPVVSRELRCSEIRRRIKISKKKKKKRKRIWKRISSFSSSFFSTSHYRRLYRRPLFGGFGGDTFGPLFASAVFREEEEEEDCER
jgi:hypothetical protein